MKIIEDKYPSIKKAILEMAYTNGMINRFEPEERLLSKANDILECYEEEVLSKIEAGISTLSEEELEHWMDGEASDSAVIQNKLPNEAEELMIALFERL